ncbi:hypothetical protein Phep_3083 [Pedobacter heparinus DSM 2366]|uniref:Uncharacterized protein n=2 Tax=Pedobacter heparinus TaxID=984 RepID=C6Y355_PEDHD|nr:hypothetical protein Phep_3083 [Pedobacter heparinus DSM 2366]
MDDGKYLISTKGIFENYNNEEMRTLLWEMYKGWFLHNATEVDSDRMIDMLLFYDELRDLIAQITKNETISGLNQLQQTSVPDPANTSSLG